MNCEIYTPKAFNYRAWQVECLQRFMRSLNRDKQQFSLCAWPGAGKTKLAVGAFCSAKRIGYAEKLLWIVPTGVLKNDVGCSQRGDLIRENLRVVNDVPNTLMREMQRFGRCSWPRDADAWIVTYQQLASDADLFAALVSQFKTMVILDECHHVQDSKSWGSKIRVACDNAIVKLPMSGTLFTTHGDSIPYVNFENKIDDDGRPVRVFKPNYEFGMEQAIRPQPGEAHASIRPLTYVKVGAEGSFTYRRLEDDKTFETFHSLEKDGKKAKLTALLNPESAMVSTMLAEGIGALDRYRNVEGNDAAAGLIVCIDGKHARAIGDRLVQMGETPLVVLHDTPGAASAIAGFRKSTGRWIVTVRMVSEGVDIKRLRVGVYLTNTLTKLFLMQWLGRMWRWDEALDDSQDGTAIIPAHAELMKWIAELENAGLEAIIANGTGGGDGGKGGTGQNTVELEEIKTTASVDGGLNQGNEFGLPSFARAQQLHLEIGGAYPVGMIAAVLEADRETRTPESDEQAAETERQRVLSSMERLVGAIKRAMIANPPSDWDGERPFAYVNGKLNKMQGIDKWSGKLATPDEVNERKELAKKFLGKLRK